MRRLAVLAAAVWACLSVVLLGTAAQATEPPLAEPSPVVVEPSPATVEPTPTPEPTPVEPVCGAVEAPCAVELGPNSLGVVGALGLTVVLTSGALVALGLRR